MSIRRRLYISNILMIVLPVVIAAMVVGSFSYAVMGALGISPTDHRGWAIDFVQDASIIASTWTEESTSAEIEASLTDVIEDFPSADTTALVILRDSQPVFSLGDATLLPSVPVASETNHSYTTTVSRVGAYTLVGVQGNRMAKWMSDSNVRWRATILALVSLGGMVAIIIGVNLFLTRFNFRHVMQPLSALTDGVRQIAEGNLSYRIAYGGKDEFVPIINDFNDMATRLQSMVAAQQKDDESRRELIAGISHDLRTPLTSIIGYVEGLEKGVAATPATQARYLSIIYDQAQTLSHIINQLFLFTKLDTDSFPMRMERIDIAQELRAYMDTALEPYAEKGMAIDLALPEEPLFVRADRVQLRNVWTNILDNSAKYGRRDSGRVDIHCLRDGGNAVITLADNGPGVDDASLEKLFTVFYRSDASRRSPKDGSGLGLAISARIIQRLGGVITAENTRPSGLLIRITLPVSKEGERRAKNTDR